MNGMELLSDVYHRALKRQTLPRYYTGSIGSLCEVALAEVIWLPTISDSRAVSTFLRPHLRSYIRLVLLRLSVPHYIQPVECDTP